MNNESVMEFLARVPLLQRLPISSLEKISQLVLFRHFEKGQYVFREGQAGDGVYFVFDGEAEVAGPVVEEDTRPEFQFKRYDYFADGISSSSDVVALTKLSCLVLPREHCDLLRPKSIWSADMTQDSCSVMDKVLHLEPIEVNKFQGTTAPEALKFGKVFGGQFVAQALAAASKTVDRLKVVHSLHAYFLLVGDYDMPIIYDVHRVRDGKSFSTRRVEGIQKGKIVFTLVASFQKQEHGFDHQRVKMPSVPEPELLLSLNELRERRITDSLFPRTYRNKVATRGFIRWPIELRFCDPGTRTSQTKSPPSLSYWFRARGKLSDDQALHRCVAAYVSDLMFLEVSLNPHRTQGIKTACVSLDHSLWFHRNFRADDWLLYVMESPAAQGARGFVVGRMFNRKGELVVSATQEGLLRNFTSQTPPTSSKL